MNPYEFPMNPYESPMNPYEFPMNPYEFPMNSLSISYEFPYEFPYEIQVRVIGFKSSPTERGVGKRSVPTLFLTLIYHVVIILGAPKPRFDERSK